jgi:hypothetical protein
MREEREEFHACYDLDEGRGPSPLLTVWVFGCALVTFTGVAVAFAARLF